MDSQHKTAFLGRDHIFPLLIKMSLPAAVGMVINALYNIVDTVFVGHGVGPLAIAALSIVFPLQMIVSSFAQAISIGAASIASRKLGEKKYEAASEAVGSAYSVVMLGTAVVVAVVFIFMEPILMFFGATKNILPYAMEYTRVVGIGFFFFSLSMCASNLVRSEGKARTSMIGMIIGAVLNIALDPLFIFGFGMGIKGAALATVISQCVSCLFFLGIYIAKKNNIPLKLSHLKIRWVFLSESLILGIPPFVQSAGMSILQLIVNNSLGKYGGDSAITIYGMNSRLISIVILPIIGIAQGFQPIAGYNYGAKLYHRVKKSLGTALLTSFCLSLAGFSLMMLAPKLCLGMFSKDRELIDAGAGVLRVMVMLIPLAAIQITSSTYFQAIGKPNESLILGLSRQFIVLIPLVIILPFLLGITGIWWSFPAADFLSTMLTLFLLLREIAHLNRKHGEMSARVPAEEPAV